MDDEDLISVTMTRAAAEQFKNAMRWASSQIEPAHPPVTDRQKKEEDARVWLNWGIGRVAHAEHEYALDAAPAAEQGER